MREYCNLTIFKYAYKFYCIWHFQSIIYLFPSFAYKIHQLEECRQFCLMHLKKMEWFNKLEQGDKSHKAMMAKNKYKVIYCIYWQMSKVSYQNIQYRGTQNILLDT